MLLAEGHKSTEGNNYHEVNDDRENNSNERNSFWPWRVGEINQAETLWEHYSDNIADHNDNATEEEL